MLSFKTALLLALACGKRVGDLHALSMNTACMEFGKNDCIVRLQPRRGNLPKVLSILFRAQVITLQAFAPQDSESVPHPLYPVHALQAYLDRTSNFRLVEQLFDCFGGNTKGLPVSKQWLSHRIVEAIALPSLSALVMKKSMSSALSRQAHRLFSRLGDTTQQDCTHSP